MFSLLSQALLYTVPHHSITLANLYDYSEARLAREQSALDHDGTPEPDIPNGH